MSSNCVGFICFKAALTPVLSNWNNPVVSPLESILNIPGSSSGILEIFNLIFLFLSISMVLLITVSVFNPRISNLTNPEFSEEYMSNCVDGKSKFESISLYKGTCSASFPSDITTPAACVARFLFNPSNLSDNSISFLTLGLLFSSSVILGSLAIDSFSVNGLDGSNGIILQILST